MAHGDLEDLRIFRRSEHYGDRLYEIVIQWRPFDRHTTGAQIVRAADSIGANIAESYGRFHFADKTQFLYYARGSAYETIFWIRRAHSRQLIDDACATNAENAYQALIISLNAYIADQKSRKQRSQAEGAKSIAESQAEYVASDYTESSGVADDPVPF